jgi:hypothetical protein
MDCYLLLRFIGYILLLMILEKIKVSIETSTNVRFITSIPVTITLREALPLILKSYHAVLH